jgi:TRAP-type C4-dicarboxylate transport system permease small subunit
MVPYDTITYAIEFHSGEPGLKREPDTLRIIVASFAVGETTWNFPLIAVFVGMTLFLLNTLINRSKEKATRLQSINFVTIKKDDEDATEGSEEAAN